MNKIAFIDLGFHQLTRSSDFFVSALRKYYKVDHYYVRSDHETVLLVVDSKNYDFVVCWQTEYLASYFILMGYKVVCIPMFDGVANHPDWFWESLKQAHFINFSKALHEKICNLGIRSDYIQYCGSQQQALQNTWDKLRPFFWQRRPREGLDYKFAMRLIGYKGSFARDGFGKIHVHNAPDQENDEDWCPPTELATVSLKSNSNNEYLEALERSNIFICPRYTEGIGMAMIEALSRGMCVIANNEPTANEYIIDGYNGILVDYRNPKVLDIDLSTAERIGKQAHRLISEGQIEWQRFVKKLPIIFERIEAPSISPNNLRYKDRLVSCIKVHDVSINNYFLKKAALIRDGMVLTDQSSMSPFDFLKIKLRSYRLARIAFGLLKYLKKIQKI